MSNQYSSTKVLELGSCAFRQFGANHSHCQYLHGYQLKAKFWFGCKELDEKNWVVDFGGLKDLKKILNDQFDHTLCIAANDPCLELFKELEKQGACVLRIMEKGVGIERTAEWCFNAASTLINEKYGDRCWVEKVEVFEHENNSALYEKPKTVTVQSYSYNGLGNPNLIFKRNGV
jgi:6-pyruvoyltetrahydropterin/6-carboxytetrahydropterin synthase